jgi:hypothetical protein
VCRHRRQGVFTRKYSVILCHLGCTTAYEWVFITLRAEHREYVIVTSESERDGYWHIDSDNAKVELQTDKVVCHNQHSVHGYYNTDNNIHIETCGIDSRWRVRAYSLKSLIPYLFHNWIRDIFNLNLRYLQLNCGKEGPQNLSGV